LTLRRAHESLSFGLRVWEREGSEGRGRGGCSLKPPAKSVGRVHFPSSEVADILILLFLGTAKTFVSTENFLHTHAHSLLFARSGFWNYRQAT
jgi:hypothetical protein